MSNRSLRYLVLVILLVAAGGATHFVQARRDGVDRPSQDQALYRLYADIDTWRRTSRERVVSMNHDMRLDADLGALPLEVGDWQGRDIEQVDAQVLEVLDPDSYMLRLYERDDGRYLWLSLIGSRKGTSFHPPQICYGGWHTVVRSEAIPLRRGELYVMSLIASRGDETDLVYHSYLWPNRERDLQDGLVMFKVMTDLQGTEDETRDLIRSFVSLWFEEASVARE
ncbi:MAG: exosortase-associated EpsI family protein [Anaerolineae bacterium]|nr:exosortase-associated EpsI family protein [Anaerolineae bacterium]